MKKIWKQSIIICIVIGSFLSMRFYAAAYTITLNGSGADASSLQKPFFVETGTIVDVATIPIPTKSGYLFKGWEYEGAIVTSFTMPTDNVSLRAIWQGMLQPVNFVTSLSNVSQFPINQEVEANTLFDVNTLPLPTHSRYVFAGWRHKDVLINNAIVIPDGGIKLTASWSGSTEEINLDVNGGAGLTNSVLNEIIESELLISTLETPTKAGYDFAGWTWKNQLLDKIFVVPEGGATFVAQWQPRINGLSLTSQSDTKTIEAEINMTLDLASLFGVKAKDVVDGDITAATTFTTSTVKPQKPGNYIIKATVKNSRGQQVVLLLTLIIEDTTAPEITVETDQVVKIIGADIDNNLLRNFGINVFDRVDGQQVLVSYTAEPAIDRYTPGEYQLTISATDTSDNTQVKQVLLVIKPMQFTGLAFFDSDNNQTFSESVDRVLADIPIYLVNGENKTEIARTTTDAKGFYRLHSSNWLDESTDYYLCTDLGDNYFSIPNKQTSYIGNKFTEKQACTNVLVAEGHDQKELLLGLHNRFEVSIPRRTISIKELASEHVDILTQNGKIKQIEVADESLVDVIQYAEGFSIYGRKKGKTELTISFQNSYENNVEKVEKIIIEIK